VEATPATRGRFLDAGVCIGLLDPNTLVTSDLHPGLMDNVSEDTKPGEMAKRSLDGLVAFLIYFFSYLAGWEAVRYLLVADADLLVAARLIVADRGMMGFSVMSLASVAAFEAALRLAAQVAKHSQPERLVSVWMSLSSQLQQVLSFLSVMQTQTQGMNIQMLLGGRSLPDPGKAWNLAASRPPHSNIADMPYEATRSLRMALLDTIRIFYLRALARLPRAELRTRYHRSMLMAGYCYGPFDPVSNIIVNMIWYDVMFAAPHPPVLDMIGPKSLTRLESRSFYGLASFLQTRYHDLSEHQLVQCLVASCAHLSVADPNFDVAFAYHPFVDPNISAAASAGAKMEAIRRQQECRTSAPGIYDAVSKMEKQRPCSSAKEAYEAAATAAWHPNPEAHAAFLSSVDVMLNGPAFLLLQNGDQLTSENVQFIASLLSSNQKPTPEQIKKRYRVPALEAKMRSEAKQRRIAKKEPMYDLHIICGANESIGSPEYCADV
uniref:PIR2-like helical domain-containing protein n=1 Tax=Aegilops tauschii subsp. strangulata TaxID=200361 RepID=A0A453EMG9_AEGTS